MMLSKRIWMILILCISIQIQVISFFTIFWTWGRSIYIFFIDSHFFALSSKTFDDNIKPSLRHKWDLEKRKWMVDYSTEATFRDTRFTLGLWKLEICCNTPGDQAIFIASKVCTLLGVLYVLYFLQKCYLVV